MKGIWEQMQEGNRVNYDVKDVEKIIFDFINTAPVHIPAIQYFTTGIYGMITWNLYSDPASNSIRFFSEHPSGRAKGRHEYIWFTPYFKGNLWKIKVYLNKKIEVYHGTIKLFFASNLKSALDKIPAHRDDKYILWKIKMKRKLNA